MFHDTKRITNPSSATNNEPDTKITIKKILEKNSKWNSVCTSSVFQHKVIIITKYNIFIYLFISYLRVGNRQNEGETEKVRAKGNGLV